ncbi:MAG: molybdenum cofactor guanylyltransferase [Bacillota bacterium]
MMESFREAAEQQEKEEFFQDGTASAAVLVGGKSRRFGYNKAFLKIGRDHLIENITARLKSIFQEVLLVGSDPAPYRFLGLPLVADVYPGCGPLAGVHAALLAAAAPYVFVTACDMPFLDLKLVSFMVKSAQGYDAVVPRVNEYLEPLYAVYGKGCLPAVETSLKDGQWKITAFFSMVRVKYIEQAELAHFNLEKVFFNINTPKDAKKALELSESAQHLAKRVGH